jgi:drug/metabolite transporter (DMT)-like permease
MRIRTDMAQLLGCLAIFGSAFCFYLSTLVVRWSQSSVSIDPSFFVFCRFLLGFMVVCIIMKVGSFRLKIHKLHFLVGRTVFNCVAVFCFYTAVSLTSVAEANILNMTYPLFVTLFAWLFLNDQRDVVTAFIVLVAFGGVWLVLSPGSIGLELNNLWGLASGLSAAAAIIYLNLCRQHLDTNTILFFMFGVGTLIILILFYKQIFIPNLKELYYLSLCAGSGILGQYLMTIGFRYVTAVEGSIISSTRILLAALLGPILAADHQLALAGWTGALLIFASNVFLAVRKAGKKTETSHARPAFLHGDKDI